MPFKVRSSTRILGAKLNYGVGYGLINYIIRVDSRGIETGRLREWASSEEPTKERWLYNFEQYDDNTNTRFVLDYPVPDWVVEEARKSATMSEAENNDIAYYHTLLLTLIGDNALALGGSASTIQSLMNTVRLHFLRWDLSKDPKMVSYIPTPKHGATGRRVKLKLGRYVKKYFPALSDTTVEEVVFAVTKHFSTNTTLKKIKNLPLQLELNSREIFKEIFETPMVAMGGSCVSCMHGKFEDEVFPPYNVYADSPGIGVAYLVDPEASSVKEKYLARTLFLQKNNHKTWVRLYGHIDLGKNDEGNFHPYPVHNQVLAEFDELLTQAGFLSPTNGMWFDMTLKTIFTSSTKIALPYLDKFDNKAVLNFVPPYTIERGEPLTLKIMSSDEATGLVADTENGPPTDGVTGWTNKDIAWCCDKCDSSFSAEEAPNNVFSGSRCLDQVVCDDCFSAGDYVWISAGNGYYNYNVIEACDGEWYFEDSDLIHIVEDETHLVDCDDCMTCPECDETYLSSSMHNFSNLPREIDQREIVEEVLAAHSQRTNVDLCQECYDVFEKEVDDLIKEREEEQEKEQEKEEEENHEKVQV